MDEGGMKPASSFHAAHTGKRLVSAAENYLALHSAEKFSLQEIANALYINGSYLLRVYKAHRPLLFPLTMENSRQPSHRL